MSAVSYNGAFTRRELNRCDQYGHRLYLTVEDTAAYFCVSKGVVLNWIRRDGLPHRMLDGRIYLHRGEVAAALKETTDLPPSI